MIAPLVCFQFLATVGFKISYLALRVVGVVDYAINYGGVVLADGDDQPTHRKLSIVQVDLAA
jgi:hypothetical protein